MATKQLGKLLFLFVLFALPVATFNASIATAAGEPVSVLTNRYDISRSGVNLNETVLNTSNVNVKQFGKLFTRAVVGDIYAQPLYYPNLSFPGKGTHNVVFVATADNNVYAFEADYPEQSTPLWEVNLGPFVTDNLASIDIWDSHDGILSTPVIDPATQTMYVVSHHPTGKNQAKHVLHALDITTGAEKTAMGSPVTIQASVASYGCDTYGGRVSLDSYRHLQRPGLLLLNNTVYIAFGSTGNFWPFHGWVLSYNAKNIRQQTARFNSSPGSCHVNGKDEEEKAKCKAALDYSPSSGTQQGFSASFWQAGTGLASDGTSIFGATGNGAFSAFVGGRDYGDSVLKLAPKLTVLDYFTPYTQYCLDKLDEDLGTTGVLLIPDTNLVIASGKDTNVYLIDKRAMGKYGMKDHSNHIVQTLSVGPGKPDTTPIFWNSPSGPMLYAWNQQDAAKQWSFQPFSDGLSTLNSTPVSVSAFPSNGAPGGVLGLSSNGNTPGTGILWGTQQTDGQHTGILRAWDATDLSKELWDTDMAPNGRDQYGKLAKFNQPTIANGKVYMATFSGTMNVYGLLSPQSGTTAP